MWRAVREWYIVGIGVLLIAGGLTLAAHQSSPPPAVNQAAGTAPDQTTPAPKTAARTAQQAAPGAASGIPAPRVTAAAVPAEQPPVSTAPAAPAVVPAAQTMAPSLAPLSHDHAAASAASETSAQAPPTPSASPASGGDPVAGRLVFRKCQVCHSLEPGKNILGPSLSGIVGRKAGAEPGYSYSPALKQADIVWDA
jgi:nitrite reductase (NO-forming)